MTRVWGVVIGLSLLIGAGVTSAEEREPAQAVELSGGVLVLEDGTRLCLVENPVVERLQVERLQEGITVKLSYEVRNGEHVVTPVETAE